MINKINCFLSSSGGFETMFYGALVAFLIYRFMPEQYVSLGWFKALYVCFMAFFTILSTGIFYANIKSAKFRSWVSVLCFFACLSAVLEQLSVINAG